MSCVVYHQIQNMSAEVIENQRKRHRLQNMTPAVQQNRRERYHVENMTPDSAQRQQERALAVAAASYSSLNVEWDYGNRCKYCSFLCLKSATSSFRRHFLLFGREIEKP